MRRCRAPDPMTPLFAPPTWRAFLRGRDERVRPINLVKAFAWRAWDQLSQILIDTGDGVLRPLYREIANHAGMPYHASGPGTMTREQLADVGITDRRLEGEMRRRFGVRVRLAGGRDTSRKRCQRFEAHRLFIDAITNEEK